MKQGEYYSPWLSLLFEANEVEGGKQASLTRSLCTLADRTQEQNDRSFVSAGRCDSYSVTCRGDVEIDDGGRRGGVSDHDGSLRGRLGNATQIILFSF